LLRDRLADRVDHFMPVSLLADQLATLERPGPDEPDAKIVDGSRGPEDIVSELSEP